MIILKWIGAIRILGINNLKYLDDIYLFLVLKNFVVEGSDMMKKCEGTVLHVLAYDEFITLDVKYLLLSL